MDVHNSKHNNPTLEADKVYVPMSHPHKKQIPIKSEFSKERLQSLLLSVLKSTFKNILKTPASDGYSFESV